MTLPSLDAVVTPSADIRAARSDCSLWLIASLSEFGVNSSSGMLGDFNGGGRCCQNDGSTLSTGNQIGKLDSIISELKNGDEKEEFVRALGNIMSVPSRDVVFRIVRNHPELDPDR